ncbi:RNA polymerase sigma factor [Pelagibacterium lentulum]|nr:sigma-70 family RNA polymerase sigma factor [Pelagibacterium lentulum]
MLSMPEKLPYAHLLQTARRYARLPEEAEDIVQDVLIAALSAGRSNFSSLADRRWMAGAIRRRAAFDARSAIRRRRRETSWEAETAPEDDAQPAISGTEIAAFLESLPPALRVIAALALSGHTRKDITYLLGISDDALRQRIRSLKKALTRNGITLPQGANSLNLDLAYGAIRQALTPFLARHGGVFASHDPDGHLFIIARSQKD